VKLTGGAIVRRALEDEGIDLTFGNTIEEFNGNEMFRAGTPALGTSVLYFLGDEAGRAASRPTRSAG
jgi:hypothetical protein